MRAQARRDRIGDTPATSTTQKDVQAPAPATTQASTSQTLPPDAAIATTEGPPPPPEAGNGSKPPIETATTTTHPQHLHTAKAQAKLQKALDYLTRLNLEAKDNKAQKWVLNESILASLTGCFRPTIRSHGLGPGHNRAKARTQQNAIKNLVTPIQFGPFGGNPIEQVSK